MSHFLRLFLLVFVLPILSLQSTLIQSASEVAPFFPNSIEKMEEIYQSAKNEAKAQLSKIISLAPKKRTFENTVLAYDQSLAAFRVYGSVLGTLKMVHPNAQMREKAKNLVDDWMATNIDLFETNREIYRSFKEFEALGHPLNAERSYYFSNTLFAFQRAGLELNDHDFHKMNDLQKQIAVLTVQFLTNIDTDGSLVRFKREELAGLNDNFIKSVKKEGDDYILVVDYPTVVEVMTNCSIEKSRQTFFRAFHNRAYPKNMKVLKKLINCRDQLAHLLGYPSYADFDIAPEMAKTVECVEKFHAQAALEIYPKIKEEWAIIQSDLPESVSLTEEGKLKGWDVAYLSNYYAKKHFNLDQEKIAEYFPVEKTIKGLLGIYEKFFSLKLKVIKGQTFWDPSVQMVEVRQKDKALLGYVLLDLFPREDKYSHACCNGIIPPISLDVGNSYQPALAVVITNFSKPTAGKPALLKHLEVKTFFHEFGHALHALLGRSEMPSKAAYNTTMDFVEMPSQLLEEWILDRDILKMISSHYETGEPLPDAMIDGLIESRGFGDSAYFGIAGDSDFLGSGILFGKISLDLFKNGQNKDLSQIYFDIYLTTPQIVAYDPEIHHVCTFGHLPAYGAKYYGYLWAKQRAQKVCAYIKTHGGLLDPVMGQYYLKTIIGRGGSCDPNTMLDDFFNYLPNNRSL